MLAIAAKEVELNARPAQKVLAVPDAIASQAPGFEQALLVQPSVAVYKPAPESIGERRATFEQNPGNAATPGEQREPGY